MLVYRDAPANWCIQYHGREVCGNVDDFADQTDNSYVGFNPQWGLLDDDTYPIYPLDRTAGVWIYTTVIPPDNALHANTTDAAVLTSARNVVPNDAYHANRTDSLGVSLNTTPGVAFVDMMVPGVVQQLTSPIVMQDLVTPTVTQEVVE